MAERTVVHSEHARQITEQYICETLDIYRPSYIALKTADWDERVLLGHFSPTEYPFTKPGHISYVTAAMAALYLSQLAYVFTRLKIEQGETAGIAITPEHFFLARDRGDLVITRLTLTCRVKIPFDVADLPVLLWQERIHRSPKHIVSKFGFDFFHGAFSGEALMAMPLPLT